MSRKIKTVITLNIEISIKKWAKIFHSKEVERIHSKFVIKPLFILFNKDDHQKFIFLEKTIQVNIQKIFQEINEWFKSYKEDFTRITELS